MKKLLVSLAMFVLLFSFVQPAHADDSLRVYYAGNDGSVKSALELAKFTFVDDSSQADVFVLNGKIPTDETITARVRSGEAGLVLILGAEMTGTQVSDLLDTPLELMPRENAVSLTTVNINDALTKEVVWNGAPQVRERFDILTPVSSVQPLVTAYEDGGWILWQAHESKYVVNAFIGEANPQIQEWGLFQLFDLPSG